VKHRVSCVDDEGHIECVCPVSQWEQVHDDYEQRLADARLLEAEHREGRI